MNKEKFKIILKVLEDEVWQRLLDGQALVLVDDSRIVAASEQPGNIIIPPRDVNDINTLRDEVMDNAGEILEHYYRSFPLSRAGFNRQVEQLIEQHGAEAFAAVYPDVSAFTLFVEGGSVVAEDAASPRYRYGAYCELQQPLQIDALSAYVKKWLSSGKAYENYISMNVCRYSCG